MVLILSHEGENTNMDILHHFSLCLGFVLLDFTDKIFNEVVIVGTPLPDDTWRASLSGATPSGLPQEEAHDTCKHHIRTIAYPYPDMLSESLTKVSKPYYVIPTTCHNPRSAACRAKEQEWWQVTSHDLWQPSIGWWWPCHHLEASWRAKKSSHH